MYVFSIIYKYMLPVQIFYIHFMETTGD